MIDLYRFLQARNIRIELLQVIKINKNKCFQWENVLLAVRWKIFLSKHSNPCCARLYSPSVRFFCPHNDKSHISPLPAYDSQNFFFEIPVFFFVLQFHKTTYSAHTQLQPILERGRIRVHTTRTQTSKYYLMYTVSSVSRF